MIETMNYILKYPFRNKSLRWLHKMFEFKSSVRCGPCRLNGMLDV